MTSAPAPAVGVPTQTSLSPSTHVKMTADIATSYLGNNPIAPERVKDVIMSIHEALREVHTGVASVGDGIRDLVHSTIASTAAVPEAAQPQAPVQLPAQAPVAETPAETPPQTEAAAAPAAAAAVASPAKTAARGGRKGRGIPAVSVPEPLADGGRVRRQPRLKAVGGTETKAPETAPVEAAPTETVAAPAETAAPAAPKVPEIAWATTELGLQPTYAPRSAKEIARIRKAVFVPEYEGKTGGFVRCLEDGQIRRMLKKHLKFLEIPPAEYLAKWGLPADFPLVHPQFSESRANQIKSAGLWEQRRAVRAKRGEEVDFDAPNVKEIQRREREARKTAKAA